MFNNKEIYLKKKQTFKKNEKMKQCFCLNV